MATKITWPLDAPEEITLDLNPDGTQSLTYVDNQDREKSVVIFPDGSRDQTVTGRGGLWRIHYEISGEGVLLMRTEMPDGTVWSVAQYPGALTQTISYEFADGTATATTYFDRGLKKEVKKNAAGNLTTVITNDDGLQHISTQP